MVITIWKELSNSHGRINRKAYLGYLLVFNIVFTLFTLVQVPFISTIFVMLGTVLMIAKTIQRLHDLDKSGNILFAVILIGFVFKSMFYGAPVYLVPIIVLIFQLYLVFSKGTVGPNQYGEDPLELKDAHKVMDTLASESKDDTK